MQQGTCSSCLTERLLVHSLFVFILPLKKCNPQNTYWTCWPTALDKLPYKNSGHSIKETQKRLCIPLKIQPQAMLWPDKLYPSVPSSWCEIAGGRNASQKVGEKPFPAPDMLGRGQGGLVSDKNCLAWCVAGQIWSPFSPDSPALLLTSPPTELRAVFTRSRLKSLTLQNHQSVGQNSCTSVSPSPVTNCFCGCH